MQTAARRHLRGTPKGGSFSWPKREHIGFVVRAAQKGDTNEKRLRLFKLQISEKPFENFWEKMQS
jgi:hypothetical protein